MTALADIRRRSSVSKSHMTVALLRGSDLAEFNEAHPRDEAGRFARAAGAPEAKDPRMARRARRLRRIRRSNRATASQATVEEAKPKEETKQETRAETSLAGLHRPRRSALNVRTKTGVQQAKKVALDDQEYLLDSGPQVLKRGESVVFVSHAEATEFLKTGSLVVGAAVDRWGRELSSQVADTAVLPPVDNPADWNQLVALRMKSPHYIDGSKKGIQNSHLANAQQIQPWLSPGLFSGYTGLMRFNTTGHRAEGANGTIEIKVIDVNAYSADEVDLGMAPRLNVKKAAAWEAEEHPRDPRSGQFAPAGGGEIDPRIARRKRRRRMAARRPAADLRARSHEPSAAEREEAAQEAERERRYAERPRRSDLNARRPLRDVGLRTAPKEEPAEEPEENFAEPIHPWEAIYPRHAPPGKAKPDELFRIRKVPFSTVHERPAEEDPLRGWLNEEGNPNFKPGMRVTQVPRELRPAFLRWERARARKAGGQTP